MKSPKSNAGSQSQRLQLGRDFELRYQIIYRNRQRVGGSKGLVVSAQEAQTFININSPRDLDAYNSQKEAYASGKKGQTAGAADESAAQKGPTRKHVNQSTILE